MHRSQIEGRRGTRRASVLLALALPLAAFAAGSARADEPIAVKVDRAKVMRIARPAATVILGNPAIADATIQDRQTLIITGRSFGTTNLIVLDEAGQPIADDLVTVGAPDDQVVTIYSGADRRSFSCSPDCEPMMRLGDSADSFDGARKQLDGRNTLVQGAVGGQPGG